MRFRQFNRECESNEYMNRILKVVSILGLNILISFPAFAQIKIDSSTGSLVLPNGNSFDVEGGRQAGNNLFHSFKEFNVRESESVIFANPANVTNIFTRITGNKASEILGTLGVAGTANLFLMNPNGIVFGPNTTIDVVGNFYATTGNTIVFEDGFEFSTEKNNDSVLEIPNPDVIPVAIKFKRPKSITVNGNGHQFVSEPQFAPISEKIETNGTTITPGGTIALLGGRINFNGGILKALGREIELAAIREGQVQLQQDRLNYEKVDRWHTISFKNKSAINGSNFGIGDSGINLSAKKIELDNNSIVLLQNFGNEIIGDINITIENQLRLDSNFAEDTSINTGIVSQKLGNGDGGNINIDACQIIGNGGGKIETYNYSPVVGSDVNIRANYIKVNQIQDLFNASNIGTYTLGEGKGGQLNIKSDTVEVLDGATLVTVTLGSGDGGNANFEVSNFKLAKISEPTEVFLSSFVGASSFSEGAAGNVVVSAEKILMIDGGGIISISFDSGNSGNVTVNADLIETKGPNIEVNPFSIPDQIENRLIFSGTISSSASSFRDDVSLDDVVANVGNVIVNAKKIHLSDAGNITGGNLGSGTGGNVFINAENIKLENFSVISGAAAEDGGNVLINTNFLSLDNSSILASSEGTNSIGNGGNIFINVDDRLLLKNNSTIRANAIGGDAGNILINTGKLLQDAGSEITASSELGVDGEILIIVPEDSENKIFNESDPEELSSQKDQWVTSCFDGQGQQISQFIVKPIQEGLPRNPYDNYVSFPWLGLEDTPIEVGNRTANTIIKTRHEVKAVHVASRSMENICQNKKAQYLIINPPVNPNGSSNSLSTLTRGLAE